MESFYTGVKSSGDPSLAQRECGCSCINYFTLDTQLYYTIPRAHKAHDDIMERKSDSLVGNYHCHCLLVRDISLG